MGVKDFLLHVYGAGFDSNNDRFLCEKIAGEFDAENEIRRTGRNNNEQRTGTISL